MRLLCRKKPTTTSVIERLIVASMRLYPLVTRLRVNMGRVFYFNVDPLMQVRHQRQRSERGRSRGRVRPVSSRSDSMPHGRSMSSGASGATSNRPPLTSAPRSRTTVTSW